MEEKKDKVNQYNQDIIIENNSIFNRIYNYFYNILNNSKEISFLEIYILNILEAIQLISYGISEPHINTWKLNNSIIKTISNILGISRIIYIMQYFKFEIYLIIFFILVSFIFTFCIFLIVQILFFKPESVFFLTSVSIIRNLINPLFIFLYTPITELVLLPLKCNSEKKIDIIKEGIKCWENMHYLYSILGIISSILFFSCICFLLKFFFYPFNYHESSIRIQTNNDIIFLFIKYIYSIRFIFVKNDYLSIAILFIFSLYIMQQEFSEHTFNNNGIEFFINLKYFLSFWTYLMLLFAKFFESTQINGIIYIYIFGIPIVIICCFLLINENISNHVINGENSNNSNEFLKKTRILIKLITSFFKYSKNIRFGKESENQKEDILLKGIIKIHALKCIREDCPLIKFIQNIGKYNIQKQCLLNYMTIYFNMGMKKFPFLTELILYYIHFNFSNRANLNSVRKYISLLQNSYNTNKINFLTFVLSEDIRHMKSKNIDEDYSNYEQEQEILNQKYRRLKYLIENSTKLYSEFWTIFANNITYNLNTFKLYNLGFKLNVYLKEINILWDFELKSKKVDQENQMIIQLYSRFLREILWNKRKSAEINKKLQDENINFQDIKKYQNKNPEKNNIEAELENPNYIIYASSNEKGECSITQCTNSIANLLGYMKNEIIGKRIEMLMPEIFRTYHTDMLIEKIKEIHHRNKSDRNSYVENNLKNIFIVVKIKMGYLIPLLHKVTIHEDADFSNCFIIKSYLEPKDTKSTYPYYILTKNDLSISAISSSAIYLGLTKNILNKYTINIELLIRNKNCENIDFIGNIHEYEDELKEAIWIYPDLLYPKDKIYNEINDEDIPNLISSSDKKKIFFQISMMKFSVSNTIGYVFKIIDSMSKKRDGNINQQSIMPNCNKEILFDLLNLNYIRTEIVSQKTKNRNLREEENNIENEKQINKTHIDKNKNSVDNINEDEIINSSFEEKNKAIELTKEKLMEMQTKDYKDIENFINQLEYYGSDVFLEKHRPNKEKYPIGKGQEALIKISLDQFIIKVEKKIKSNPELKMKYKGMKENESESNDIKNNNKNEINPTFSSDISAILANVFKSMIITNIKLFSFIFFLLFLGVIIIEFIFTFLNVNTIQDNISKMRNAYRLCEDIGFIKYMITEAVISNKYKDDYIILIIYEMTLEENIGYQKWELEAYSYEFRSIYDSFTSTPASEFSERYRKFVSTDTQVLIYTISNNMEVTQYLPYSIAMNRIPNTIFYVSSMLDDSIELNMRERNTYELVFNLLNGYYTSTKDLTLILAEDAVISSKISIISLITFYSSFLLVIIFLIIMWYLLQNFLLERQRPINLFLTIKKHIFDDLKKSSEDFSNKLLNKMLGNEENEEENQKDYQNNIKENDINIIKFTSPPNYKRKGNDDKAQICNFFKLVIFFIFMEGYIIFKYSYADYYINSVKKFLDVFNITLYSYVDIIINIDLSKSFFYNKSIPIFYETHSENNIDKESPFYTMFYNITESFESMIISTSETTSFLSGTYKKNFAKYLYEDFSGMIFVNTSYLPNRNLLSLFEKGFKPVVSNIFERLRFFWIKNYKNLENTINDKRWCDIDFLILYVVRPWYNKLIEIMQEESDKFLNGARIIQISLFIVFIVIFIMSYFIIWKSYEERLSNLLERSFDLIKLIPEEIKYLIVSKLNE